MLKKVGHAAMAGVLVATIAQPTQAQAGGRDAAIAAGILGALMLGAAGAAAAHPRYYVQHPRRQPVQRAAAVPQKPKNVTYSTVSAADPSNVHFFWNCSRRPLGITAKADFGYIRTTPSTRYVCGNPDFPVTEFEYAPSNSGGSNDKVVYIERGRILHTDFLTLDPSIKTPAPSATRTIFVPQNEETVMWTAWSCDANKSPDISVSARNGYTTVRDEFAEACGEQNHPVKHVYYRAARDYTGSDMVVIRSSTARPANLPIQVIPADQAANHTSAMPSSSVGEDKFNGAEAK